MVDFSLAYQVVNVALRFYTLTWSLWESHFFFIFAEIQYDHLV